MITIDLKLIKQNWDSNTPCELSDEEIIFCYECAERQYDAILSRHELNPQLESLGKHSRQSLIEEGGLTIALEINSSCVKTKKSKKWRQKIKQIVEHIKNK